MEGDLTPQSLLTLADCNSLRGDSTSGKNDQARCLMHLPVKQATIWTMTDDKMTDNKVKRRPDHRPVR